MQAIKDQQTIREWATALGVPFTIVQPWQLRLQLNDATHVDIYPRRRQFEYHQRTDTGSSQRYAPYDDVDQLLAGLLLPGGPESINEVPLVKIGPTCELPLVMELKGHYAGEGMHLVHLRPPFTVARAIFYSFPSMAKEAMADFREGQAMQVPGYGIILVKVGSMGKAVLATPSAGVLMQMAYYFASYIIPPRAGRYKRYKLPA